MKQKAHVLRTGKVYVQVALERVLIERVDEVAKAAGISRSAMLRQMIKESIDEADTFVQVMQSPGIYRALKGVFTDPEVAGLVAESLRAGSDKPSVEAQRQMLIKFANEVAEGVRKEARSVHKKGGRKK